MTIRRRDGPPQTTPPGGAISAFEDIKIQAAIELAVAHLEASSRGSTESKRRPNRDESLLRRKTAIERAIGQIASLDWPIGETLTVPELLPPNLFAGIKLETAAKKPLDLLKATNVLKGMPLAVAERLIADGLLTPAYVALRLDRRSAHENAVRSQRWNGVLAGRLDYGADILVLQASLVCVRAGDGSVVAPVVSDGVVPATRPSSGSLAWWGDVRFEDFVDDQLRTLLAVRDDVLNPIVARQAAGRLPGLAPVAVLREPLALGPPQTRLRPSSLATPGDGPPDALERAFGTAQRATVLVDPHQLIARTPVREGREHGPRVHAPMPGMPAGWTLITLIEEDSRETKAGRCLERCHGLADGQAETLRDCEPVPRPQLLTTGTGARTRRWLTSGTTPEAIGGLAQVAAALLDDTRRDPVHVAAWDVHDRVGCRTWLQGLVDVGGREAVWGIRLARHVQRLCDGHSH
ncbi:MAG: hypothetical protein QOH17_2025 [Pseudonocardiales bacterium]|nr:hypothetical protein [Pseudonocardiales bacterium]